MKPRLIRTEADYEEALSRVNTLLGSLPGSPEGDELDLLVHLIEVYENEHYPVSFPDPVEAIRFRMEQKGLKQADMIPYFGSKSRVSEVLSGRRKLSLSMMRKLRDGLGIPAVVLLGTPSAEIPAREEIDPGAYPLTEMVKRNWFGDCIRSKSDLLDQAEEVFIPFLAPVMSAVPASSWLRHKPRAGGKMDENALTAWKARVWQLAQKQEAASYSNGVVNRRFMEELTRLSFLRNGPLAAREYLAAAGIRMVIEPQMPHTHLDGAAMRLEGQAPIVALTLRHDRLDNFWFTLCHELAHVSLHLRSEDSASYLDDLEAADETRAEREADRLAMNAMIPEADWKAWREDAKPSRASLLEFASSIRVHPSIVAGRHRRETGNYKAFTDLVGCREVRSMFGFAD